MPASNQTTPTAIVTGASRGFGRAIAGALHADGAQVVAVARNAEPLKSLGDELGGSLTPWSRTWPTPSSQARCSSGTEPDVARAQRGRGAASRARSISTRGRPSAATGTSTSPHLPLDPRGAAAPAGARAARSSRSPAARPLFGSPLSGGYAGAKATVRFITGYAADESARAGLGIRFVSVLPKLTPATDLGAMAVAAYARRDDITIEEYLERLGPASPPEDVGKATLELVVSPDTRSGAYLLTPDGLSPLP